MPKRLPQLVANGSIVLNTQFIYKRFEFVKNLTINDYHDIILSK